MPTLNFNARKIYSHQFKPLLTLSLFDSTGNYELQVHYDSSVGLYSKYLPYDFQPKLSSASLTFEQRHRLQNPVSSFSTQPFDSHKIVSFKDYLNAACANTPHLLTFFGVYPVRLACPTSQSFKASHAEGLSSTQQF